MVEPVFDREEEPPLSNPLTKIVCQLFVAAIVDVVASAPALDAAAAV